MHTSFPKQAGFSSTWTRTDGLSHTSPWQQPSCWHSTSFVSGLAIWAWLNNETLDLVKKKQQQTGTKLVFVVWRMQMSSKCEFYFNWMCSHALNKIRANNTLWSESHMLMAANMEAHIQVQANLLSNHGDVKTNRPSSLLFTYAAWGKCTASCDSFISSVCLGESGRGLLTRRGWAVLTKMNFPTESLR